MKIARVRRKSVCAMELVGCRALNQTESALNFKVHHLELLSCLVERLDHEPVIHAIMDITLLAYKAEFVRLMVSIE